MPVDGATLGLRLTNAQAIADAKASGAAFEDMGVKGETAARKIAASSNPVTEAIKRQALTVEQSRRAWAASGGDMNRLTQQLSGLSGGQDRLTDSTRRMTLMQMEAIAINQKMDASVSQNRLSVGRLGNQFTSLISQIAGVHPVVGNLTSVLGNFAVGSLLMTGILGGTAILAALYDTITKGARKARQEQEQLTESLAKQFQPKTGPESETGMAYSAALKQQADAMLRLRLLQGARTDFGVSEAFRGAGLAAPTRSREIELERETERLRLANRALGRARAGGGGILETVTVQSDLAERTRDRERETAQRDAFEAGQRQLAAERAEQERRQKVEARQLSLVPDRTSIPLVGQLTAAQMKHVESIMRLDAEYIAAKKIFSSTNAAVENFKEGLKGAATGLLQQFSPSNIAQGLVNGLTQKIEGMISGLIESAVGGIRRAVFGQSGAEKAAAREAEDSARAMALGLDAVTKSLQGNVLGATINALQISLISTLQAINAALPGTKNEAERNRARALAERQTAQQEELARKQFAQAAQYAQEDLAVRNLKATGFGDQAGLLAFQQQQQREMQAAIDANKDELYMNTLRMVQNNELIAYQNGLLATAMRNAPTGFYGVERYLGQFATPSGPAGYPIDGGLPPVNPLGPNTGPGGLTPPGGRGPITIVLQVDGKVLTRTVVNGLDQAASATGGAGSSRAAALERY